MADPFGGVFGAALGGTAIGAAIVKLQLDTKEYQAQIAKAKGQTDAQLAGMGQSASRWSAYMQAAAAMAAAAIVKFGIDAVRAYQDHEDAVLQLQNTIRNSPQLIGASTKAFEDQATAIQNLTGYQDEEILRADAVLGRFKLTAEQIQKLNPLIADYARATGQDMVAAAGNLGRALLGNTRALKAIGIEFTVTGDRTRDVARLTDALQGKVDGVATAYGKTLAGQLAIANAKWDDFKEAVGKVLSEIATDFMPVVQDLLTVLDKLGPALGTVAKGFELILSPARDVVQAMTWVEKRFGGVGDTLANDLMPYLPALVKEFGNVGDAGDETGRRLKHFADMGQAAFKQWRQDSVADLNAVQGSLGDLANKANLTAEEVLKAFDKQLRAMARYQDNWEKLLARGLPDSLVKQLQDMGMQGANIVAALASANQRQFNRIVSDWNRAQTEAVQTANAVAKIGASISNLHSKTITITVEQNPIAGGKQLPPPPGHHASGGIFPGGLAAGGLIATGPTLLGSTLVGEGSYPTRFGRGAEAVLPLDDATMARLGRHIASAMPAAAPQLNLTINGGVWGLADLDRHIMDLFRRQVSTITLQRAVL